MTQAQLIIWSDWFLALFRQINKAFLNMASFIIFLVIFNPTKEEETKWGLPD